MCKFCEDNDILKSVNFCGNAKMRISCNKDYNYLDVYGDKKIFKVFEKYYNPSFIINYCPECGKNLNNLNDYKENKDSEKTLNIIKNKIQRQLDFCINENKEKYNICNIQISFLKKLIKIIEKGE